MQIQAQIEKKISDRFLPSFMSVLNESYMHNVPKGAESHFKVIIVSETFCGQRLLARHRAVNQCLSEELASAIHALAIHTYTASEWLERNALSPISPDCQGGSKK